MRHATARQPAYSPSDLSLYTQSRFATWMERLRLEFRDALEPDDDDDESRILQRRGDAYEAQRLAELKAEHPDLVDIEQAVEAGGLSPEQAAAHTREALRWGAPVVFQAYLAAPPFAGMSDFLFRVDGASGLGDFHYEVWDTKLARSARPKFLIQLACYTEMLEAAQGRRPESLVVWLGDGRTSRHRSDDVLYYYRRVKRGFLAEMQRFDDALAAGADFDALLAMRPEPESGASHGRWASHADDWFERRDHLSRVANLRSSQIPKLHAMGIETLAALARSDATADDAAAARLDPRTFEQLREQAALQHRTRTSSDGGEQTRPAYRVLSPDDSASGDRRDAVGLQRLPPASPGDLFFDLEGYPHVEDGLEYLWGASFFDLDRPRASQGETAPDIGLDFWSRWAHDRAAEQRAFEAFVDFATERLERDPTMHIYHYADYERRVLSNLMNRFGTREREVDHLLRSNVLVDLYQVVREGLRVGEPSYSIKNLERLYRPAREGDVQTAGASIVYYDLWSQSGEGDSPATSELLGRIRDYNRDDCESTFQLAAWLRERQAETGIAYAAPQAPEDEPTPPDDDAALCAEMLEAVPADPEESEREHWRIQTLLAQLQSYHRREAKPGWWAAFERRDMSPEQLVHETTCLGDLMRDDDVERETLKRSLGVWYRFDPDQFTRLSNGSSCYLAHHDPWVDVTLEELDAERGRALLKFGGKSLGQLGGEPPEALSLIPKERVTQKPLPGAIRAVARRYHEGNPLPGNLRALLSRERPTVADRSGGPLVPPERRRGDAFLSEMADLALGLRDTTLCLQGPPGAGKTHVSAHMILALVKAGKKVGVTSNSHDAIENLLAKCCTLARERELAISVGKVPKKDRRPGERDLFVEFPDVREIRSNGKLGDEVAHCDVVGATAWGFAADPMEGALDVLFVDEAGQVSLANAVAMARSARSLVLVGDQMQLSQPTQGSHPGDSGRSALDYLLRDHAVIPDDLGVFLDRTWRLHPDLCAFVSRAIYQGRLEAEPQTAGRVVRLPDDPEAVRRVPVESGLLHVPVTHRDNEQSSDEEVAVVRELVGELCGRTKTDEAGEDVGVIGLDDILIVAPYNLQVRKLQAALPRGVRVGTVDRFQGREAAIAIVSMCSSRGDTSPRGIPFLFDPQRMNVAVSRARSLAIVVGSPMLAETECSTVANVALVNLFCRIVDEGTRHEAVARG